jgi:hypothetical protein
MFRTALLSLFFSYACFCLCAQVAVTDLSLTYSENFNSLPQSASSQEDPWTDDSTLPDWFAENEEVETLNIRYGSSRSTGGSSSSGLYSFGDRTIPEMALGVITSNSSEDITFGTKYVNQSGETIESVTVTYTGEQWRISNGQQPQVLGFSYLVSGSDPTIAIPERTGGYVYVPELYFTSPKFDTTGLVLAGATGQSMDGNLTENRTQITFTFNVSVADGEYILLRWYKENSSKIEFALAIDDLSVDFSNEAITELSFNSNSSIYNYINGPIDLRIPDEDDTEAYDPPVTVESGDLNPEETEWRSLIQNILAENYSQARSDAPSLGYELISFYDGTNSNKLHYILRHNGSVDNLHHWGTYIFNSSPSNADTHLSIPHPIHDSFTARQGGYLYQKLDVASIQISGNYRCSSNVASGCHGSTSVCTGITDFRESDAAHSVEHPFQYTSEEIADDAPDSYFIQLHGFAHSGGDPDLIISNGTDQTPSGSDHVADLVNYIDSNSSFNAAGVHSDPYDDKLTGYTNTFGRYLNAHQGDICSSDQIADNSTGRFIHVEQRGELREIESNYSILEDALQSMLATPLPLGLTKFDHICDLTQCLLRWTSFNSNNVDQIEVYGSMDGFSFTYLGGKKAVNDDGFRQSTYPLRNHYHNYYQLETVDFDGSRERLWLIKASHQFEETKIFPNLINDHLNILAPIGTNYVIHSLQGKIVNTGTVLSRPHKVEADGLPRGIYFLELNNTRSSKFKLIKE